MEKRQRLAYLVYGFLMFLVGFMAGLMTSGSQIAIALALLGGGAATLIIGSLIARGR